MSGHWNDEPERPMPDELGYVRDAAAPDITLVGMLANQFPEPGKLAVVKREDLDRLVRLARQANGGASLGIAFIDFDWLGAQP